MLIPWRFQFSILWRFPTGLARKVGNVVFAVVYSHGTCRAVHWVSLNQLSHRYALCVPTQKMKESGFLPWRSSRITGEAEGYTYNCHFNGCYFNPSPKNYFKVVFKRHWKLATWLPSPGLAWFLSSSAHPSKYPSSILPSKVSNFMKSFSAALCFLAHAF